MPLIAAHVSDLQSSSKVPASPVAAQVAVSVAAAAAPCVTAETWDLLSQLPLDLSCHIVALGDVLEVFSPLLETSVSHLRLAAQLWRRVWVLSRAHRQAAVQLLCSSSLPIKLEDPSFFTEPACRSSLQAWLQLVASQPPMRGLSAGLLEVWTRLPNRSIELRSLHRLTLTSVPGRSPNSFNACNLPDLPCLDSLRLLDFSRMELAGLPASVKRVTLVPPTSAAHFTACWLAPLGTLPAHRLDSLTIGRRRKPAGSHHTVVALNLHRLCAAATAVMVHGSHTVLCCRRASLPRRVVLRDDMCCQMIADAFLSSGAEQLAMAMLPSDKVFMIQLPANTNQLGGVHKEAADASQLLEELAGEEHVASWPADLAVAYAVACAAALAIASAQRHSEIMTAGCVFTAACQRQFEGV